MSENTVIRVDTRRMTKKQAKDYMKKQAKLFGKKLIYSSDGTPVIEK